VDLDIVNNDQTTNNDPPQLRFEETRNSPYMEGDSRDYFCSILRFSIQTGNELPIFIPRIITGQPNPNLTVYSVSIKSPTTGQTVTAPLIYQPWNNKPTPPPPTTKQDVTNGYYFVNSYTQFVQMLNTALKTCHDLYWNDPTADGHQPYVQFDSQSNLFVLYCDEEYYDPNPVTPTPGRQYANIFFNTRLYQLLSSFPSIFVGNEGDANYKIYVDNMNGSNIVETGCKSTCKAVVPVFQEISTVATWNPVASVVFCSSLIPVLVTNTSPPKLYGDNSTNLTSSGANNNLTNILTDFEVPITETNQYRPAVTFTPSSEYRLIDMNSVMNLNKLDLIVFWKSHYGELIPLRLQPGNAAHIKIMFRHRKFNADQEAEFP
jgi:hypothetical protein